MRLFDNHDGANYQAQCVLAILRHLAIEESWDADRMAYDFEPWSYPEVDRWQNCREQGYVIYWRLSRKQINIAFFEHRNSDNICAVEWEQLTTNAPTIDTMDRNQIYKDKWDVSKTVSYNKFSEMADWIMERLTAFYLANKKRGK